jgi:SNF2 family DNA or RNA helicase
MKYWRLPRSATTILSGNPSGSTCVCGAAFNAKTAIFIRLLLLLVMAALEKPSSELRMLGRVCIHLTLESPIALSAASGLSPGSCNPSPSSSAHIDALCEKLGVDPLLGRSPSRALVTLAALARRETQLDLKAAPLPPLSPANAPERKAYVISVSVRPSPGLDIKSGWSPEPVVVRPSEHARKVFWHMLREQTPGRQPMSYLAQEPPSLCGFVGCGGSCSGDGGGKPGDFRLERIFARCKSPVIPPPAGPIGSIGLFDLLPDEALEHLSRTLAPRDLASFAGTCQTIRRVVMSFVPGLNLRLYRHQASAVWRMLDRERSPRPCLPLPLSRSFPVEEKTSGVASVPYHVDMATGAVHEGHILNSTPDCRGGLFCDEPGLGKTITALAVILRTLGQQAQPPPEYMDTIEIVPKKDDDEVSLADLLDIQTNQSTSVSTISWGSNLPHLFYRPTQAGRYLPFGYDEVDNLFGRRGDLTNRRSIRAPDFHNPNMGKGSLPVLGLHNASVFLSGATLVVVPPMLVSHWTTQIEKHVRSGVLRVLAVKFATEIPPAEQLAYDYDVIIISFKVLNAVYTVMREQAPSLLCVKFLRIILDEGHKLGASRSGISNFARVCESLKAERRWIMTGTPTPSTPDTDVRHLQPLLQFIRDDSYGRPDRDAWMRGIQRPYEAFHPEALERLDKLLTRVMIRSSKSDVSNLPPCIVKDVILDFSEDGASCYNELVFLARRNLVLSDWMDDAHAESILNPKNTKECLEFLSNLRSACNFGGIINMEFCRADLSESLEMLYREAMHSKNGLFAQVRPEDMYLHLPQADQWWGAPVYAPTEAALLVDDFVGTAAQLALEQRANSGTPGLAVSLTVEEKSATQDSNERALCLPRKHAASDSKTHVEFRGIIKSFGERLLRGCHCESCKTFCQLPILSTCGHMVCVDCFSSNRLGCTVPGCVHKYVLDSSGVPEKVIELQPSVESDSWKPEWDKAESMKMKYLLSRLNEIGERTVWTGSTWRKRRPKVIIYSQFIFHQMLLTLTLNSSIYQESYVELFTNENERDDVKKSESRDSRASRFLEIFVRNESKHILILGTTNGSVGLDLSIVEYIFLLEPIWDSSLEQQVIARAHRLGARNTVYVERIAMRGSIEEQMLLQGNVSQSGVYVHNRMIESERRGSLMKNLSTVKAGSPCFDAGCENTGTAGDQSEHKIIGMDTFDVVTEDQNYTSIKAEDLADGVVHTGKSSAPVLTKIVPPPLVFNQRQRRISNIKRNARMRNTALDRESSHLSIAHVADDLSTAHNRSNGPEKKRVRFEM